MADFDTLEESRESSRPIEVYEIVLGSKVFRWTSAEDDLVIGTNTFEAIPISRNQVLIGADQQRRTLLATVPGTNEFVANYVNIIPGERASFSLFRYQRDESPPFDTTVLLFSGKVQSVKFINDGSSAQIAVRSIEAALSRNVPRTTYGGMCGAFLYDAFCGADPNLHDHIGEVTLVSGNDITIAGADASGHDFVGGYGRPVSENDFRRIDAQAGDVLTLSLPFHLDQTGANVQAFAGCDHLIAGDCALVFDRVADFMGFAFVPTKNVFRTGLDWGFG